MKKTFKEIKEIDNAVENLFSSNPSLKNTKFGYAYKRFYEKNYAPAFKLYREALTDIRAEYALVDPITKEILFDKMDQIRGFKYAKEEFLFLLKKEREVQNEFDEKEFEVSPHISSFVPDNIHPDDAEVMKGILIPIDYQPKSIEETNDSNQTTEGVPTIGEVQEDIS